LNYHCIAEAQGFAFPHTHTKRKYNHACISEALAIMAAASGSAKRTKITIHARPLEIDVVEF